MGLYLRNNRYYFKKQIDHRAYYVALKLRRGQESLLTYRIKQAEDSIIAKHFNLPPPMQPAVTLADYVHIYLKQKQHKKTFDRDKQRLLRVIQIWGDPILSHINKMHVKKLEDMLFQRGLKSTTVNRYFELLSHMFNLAIEDRYITENPCKYYQRFVEDYTRRALTKPEIKKILGAAKAMQRKPENSIQAIMYDLILFSLNTGMRLSEVLFLKKEYINNNIIIYPIKYTKYKRRINSSNKSTVKIVYLNTIAKSIIDYYNKESPLSPIGSSPPCHALHAIPVGALHPVTSCDKNSLSVTSARSPLHSVTERGDYIFPMPRRDPNAIFRTVQKLRFQVGVPDFCFHQLRHTVSSWVAAYTSLFTAKTILGHSDIRTTLRYSHPEITEQKRGVARIEAEIRGLLPK